MFTTLPQDYRICLLLPLLLSLPFIACDQAVQNNELIHIKQEQVSFHSEIEVQFTNIFNNKIAILTVGCSNSADEFLPSHSLEKLENNKWGRAGAPICIAIASPPIILAPGGSHSISIPVDIGLEEAAMPGIFRFRFDIREVSEGEDPKDNKLDEELRTSPVFRITGP